MKPNPLKEAWARLTEAHSFVLACHQNPDGDTLGAALALANALRQAGKDVVVVAEDGVPDIYEFVPESDTIVRSTDRRDFDYGVLIDCEGIKRIGSARDAVASGRHTACIDHHVPDDEFGDVRVIDTAASSTAELMLDLLLANDIPITKTIAEQLMAGIVSDTGGFRFANVTADTFRAAAVLAEAGAKSSPIIRNVYESRSLVSLKLLGQTLSSLTLDPTGRIVWAIVRRQDLDELGATEADTESVVNHVGQVRGPLVAILFRESKPESIRISLRSRDGIDVGGIARVFGGGGHPAAAGCTVELPLEAAIRRVVDEVTHWMES